MLRVLFEVVMDIVVVGERRQVGGEWEVRKQHDLFWKIGPEKFMVVGVRLLTTQYVLWKHTLMGRMILNDLDCDL